MEQVMDLVKAFHIPSQKIVDVVQDREDYVFIKFPDGKTIWVPSGEVDFDDLGGDDDWGPENMDDLGFGQDQYDIEYDR
jgi:hypothetical protein